MANQQINTDAIKRATEINVSKKLVKVTRSTKHPARGRVECKWELDFSKVTPEQLYELATRSAVIDYQRTFRDLTKDESKKMDVGNFDVSELFVAKERKTLSPMEQAKRAASKLSPAEKAELLKALGIK